MGQKTVACHGKKKKTGRFLALHSVCENFFPCLSHKLCQREEHFFETINISNWNISDSGEDMQLKQ